VQSNNIIFMREHHCFCVQFFYGQCSSKIKNVSWPTHPISNTFQTLFSLTFHFYKKTSTVAPKNYYPRLP